MGVFVDSGIQSKIRLAPLVTNRGWVALLNNGAGPTGVSDSCLKPDSTYLRIACEVQEPATLWLRKSLPHPRKFFASKGQNVA